MLRDQSGVDSVAAENIPISFSVSYDPAENVYRTLLGDIDLNKWEVIAIEKPTIVLSNGMNHIMLDFGEFWDDSAIPEIGTIMNIEMR